jgi:divalent metal cation (Fe/Co/Zn/Cd) transporter
LETVTVVWMALEAAGAIGAGVVAGSLLLVAFGADSLIELASGLVLRWRLAREALGRDLEGAERTELVATRISAALLVLLCVYVLASIVAGVVARLKPEASPLGIGVSALALVVMPLLALAKRRVNIVLGSAALRADIAETTACAFMSGTVLVGLVLNERLGWWWAEYVALAGLLVWLTRETNEVIEAVREGRAGYSGE